MSKKVVKAVNVVKYRVMRGIINDDFYRFVPGDVVTEADLGDVVLDSGVSLVDHWVKKGALEVITNGDG